MGTKNNLLIISVASSLSLNAQESGFNADVRLIDGIGYYLFSMTLDLRYYYSLTNSINTEICTYNCVKQDNHNQQIELMMGYII